MTRTYTAADFANAQFAKHPDGRVACRLSTKQEQPWRAEAFTDLEIPFGVFYVTDRGLAQGGWVPVPMKPTLTDPEVGDITEHKTDDWLDGFITGYEKAGGTILEEAAREKVARLVNEMVDGRGIVPVGRKVADRLINLGLVKDN